MGTREERKPRAGGKERGEEEEERSLEGNGKGMGSIKRGERDLVPGSGLESLQSPRILVDLWIPRPGSRAALEKLGMAFPGAPFNWKLRNSPIMGLRLPDSRKSQTVVCCCHDMLRPSVPYPLSQPLGR